MKNILILFLSCVVVLGLNAQNDSYPNYDNDHQHEDHNNDHNHDHNHNDYYESDEEPYYNKNKEYRKRRKSKSKHRHDHNGGHGNGSYGNGYDHEYDDYGYEGNMYDQAVYWHLVPLGYNTFQLSYEMRHLAEDGGIRAWLFSGGLTLSNKLRQAEQGFMGEVQYRYYFNRMGPNFELYGAPYAQFRKLSRERGTLDAQGAYVESFDNITSFSGGILFGLHFFLFDQFIIELQGGGGFAISQIPDDVNGFYGDNPWEVGYTGISVKGGINIGFAF